MALMPGRRVAGILLTAASCLLLRQALPFVWATGPQQVPRRAVILDGPQDTHFGGGSGPSQPIGGLPLPPGGALVMVSAVALALSARSSKGGALRRLGATMQSTEAVATESGPARKIADFAMKLFDLADLEKNNTINYQEFQFCTDMLTKCNIELSQKAIDAFFYRSSASQIEDWERASVEWMNEEVEGDVSDIWAEQRFTIDRDFTYQEFADLVKTVDAKHSLGIIESDIQAGWQDLHANYFNKRSMGEFAHAVKTACGDRFRDIAMKTERQAAKDGNRSMDGKKVRLVKQQLMSQHGFELSQEDTLLFFRTHGRISRAAWFKGMTKLLEKDRANNPKQKLSSEILTSDPEIFRATLDNGIPRQMTYDFDQWQRAQSSDRYWKSIRVLATQQSSLRRIWWPLMFCIVLSFCVAIGNRFLKPILQHPILSMPVEFFSLSSAPLGLLLVFRTNMSYARFDEARKVWGDSLNRCRDLMRQAAWISNERERSNFLSLIPTFATSLKCLLRKPSRHDLALEAGPHLTQREIRQMMTTDLPAPIWALRTMGRLSDSVHAISPMKHQLMSTNISELIANVGKCERIFSTPMPATYTALTTRFLLVWLALLPFMLYPKIGEGVIIAQTLMAFFLLGIEDLGCQIEEPFSVLPLSRIVRKITAEARAHQQESSPDARVAPVPPPATSTPVEMKEKAAVAA